MNGDGEPLVPRLDTIHTTLIRDKNGLGFSIAGGKGVTPYQDGTDVSVPLPSVPVGLGSGGLVRGSDLSRVTVRADGK